VNSLSRIPPSLAESPLRRKTALLLGLYEFLRRARNGDAKWPLVVDLARSRGPMPKMG
jgi:hypothetical protein